MFLYSSFYIVVAQYFSSHNVEQANKINLNKHNNGTCMAVFPAAFEWLNIQCNFPNIWALYLIFNTKSRMGKLLMISSGFQATVQTLILIHLSQDVKCSADLQLGYIYLWLHHWSILMVPVHHGNKIDCVIMMRIQDWKKESLEREVELCSTVPMGRLLWNGLRREVYTPTSLQQMQTFFKVQMI